MTTQKLMALTAIFTVSGLTTILAENSTLYTKGYINR
jgi:hypothetical protein